MKLKYCITINDKNKYENIHSLLKNELHISNRLLTKLIEEKCILLNGSICDTRNSFEINDILKIFKKEKQHFALIMDEYGGVDALITMEDILEEIVGDISDENDDKNDSYSIRKDGSYIVDGKLNLEDFCDLFNINHDDIETEYVTIGGFCVELLDDKFAKLNDVIHFKNLTMRVIAIDKNNAIEKLHVKIDDEIKE